MLPTPRQPSIHDEVFDGHLFARLCSNKSWPPNALLVQAPGMRVAGARPQDLESNGRYRTDADLKTNLLPSSSAKAHGHGYAGRLPAQRPEGCQTAEMYHEVPASVSQSKYLARRLAVKVGFPSSRGRGIGTAHLKRASRTTTSDMV